SVLASLYPCSLFFLIIRPPPRSPLFPYTTLFRSKRSAVGFLLRSLIMFQTFISRHNSNFFSDKLVLTSVTPASSAPVLTEVRTKIGRAVQQECRDRSRMPSSA